MKVNVIIPALNEPYLSTLTKKLEAYQVTVCEQKGLAYAVFVGLRYSEAKIVVVMDADGSHPTETIPQMINMLNSRTWFIIGSRYCKGAYSMDFTRRKIISLFYCILTRFFLRTKIKDPMSGFWVGYRKTFKFKPVTTYKFGLQLIKKYKQHIIEYPIFFCKRKQGSSHVKPLQALKDFLSIICVFL